MAGRIEKHYNFIKKFQRAPTLQRNAYLKRASADEVRSLCECALNVCNGNIPLNKKQFGQLKKHKKILKTLAFTKSSPWKKRRVLLQEGGFLPVLASTALSFLGPIIASAIEKL
jgi:hypothetical protein